MSFFRYYVHLIEVVAKGKHKNYSTDSHVQLLKHHVQYIRVYFFSILYKCIRVRVLDWYHRKRQLYKSPKGIYHGNIRMVISAHDQENIFQSFQNELAQSHVWFGGEILFSWVKP